MSGDARSEGGEVDSFSFARAGRRLALILKRTDAVMGGVLSREQRDALKEIREAAEDLMALLPREVRAALEENDAGEEPGFSLDVALDEGGANGVRSMYVLVVEDNPSSLELMRRLLEARGHTVMTAKNGGEALTLLELESFDLVLTDLRMPEMDGFEAAARIRDREAGGDGSRMPIIAVTALTAPEDRQRVAEAGIDGYHPKPVQREGLFSEIERVVRLAEEARQGEGKGGTMSDVNDQMQPSLLDMEKVMKSMDGDREIFQEIVELFLSDYPGKLADGRRHIEAGAAAEAREEIHSLKGSLGAFGRTEAFEAAYKLEEICRSGDLTNAMASWAVLDAMLVRVRRELEAALND